MISQIADSDANSIVTLIMLGRAQRTAQSNN
jgi:hypothetical protein